MLIAAIVANSLLATLLLMSAYGGMINPLRSPYAAIIAMTFPAILIISVIVSIVNLIWMRRMAVINGLSLLLCLGPILTFCPLNFFRPDEKEIAESGEPTLKVLSFNTFGFSNFSDGNTYNGDATIEFILRQDADIVLCQEAEGILTDGYKVLSDESRKQLRNLYPYVKADHRGMAVLSKYPFNKVHVENADPNQLDLCRYDVDINGFKLHLFSLHMQSIGLTAEDKELYRNITEGESSADMDQLRVSIIAKLKAAFRSRAVQARIVRQAIDETDGNILLCGDFNDIPGSFAARTIAGDDLTDAYRHAGLGPAITYHADRLYFRIDQMFYRGDLDAIRTWVGDCHSSDHYPLIAIFRIGAQNQRQNNQ